VGCRSEDGSRETQSPVARSEQVRVAPDKATCGSRDVSSFSMKTPCVTISVEAASGPVLGSVAKTLHSIAQAA